MLPEAVAIVMAPKDSARYDPKSKSLPGLLCLDSINPSLGNSLTSSF